MQLPAIKKSFMNNRTIQHILFWIFFFSLEILDLLEHTEISSFGLILLIPLLKIWDTAVIVYLNRLFFIPRLFNKKKYFLHIILVIVTILCLSVLSYLILSPLLDTIEFFGNRPRPKEMIFWGSAIHAIMLTIITSLIHFTKEGIKLKDIVIKLTEVKKEKLIAELKLLKAQVNPHFLFNMLNNIYSLSLEKSDKSPKMILMLADLMSYILYDCQEEKVSLAKEITFLKNLIDLEEISVGDSINIKYNVDESLSAYNVAPLLFIPFVENAFKHCSKNGKDKSFVTISLIHDNDNVCLSIENSVDQNTEIIKDNYQGVGIKNAQKRLELLYPKTHHLSITEEVSLYKVELHLKL